MEQHPKRSEIQVQEEMDEIFRLQIAGATRKQICEIRNLPERTYDFYNKRLKERIVSFETSKRQEEILVQKEICRQRLNKARMGEQKIAEDEKTSQRVKMDAWYRYSEISVAEFKLEAETANWLAAYNNLHLREPPVALTELEEERSDDDGKPYEHYGNVDIEQ